jgi:hypothetical protein
MIVLLFPGGTLPIIRHAALGCGVSELRVLFGAR